MGNCCGSAVQSGSIHPSSSPDRSDAYRRRSFDPGSIITVHEENDSPNRVIDFHESEDHPTSSSRETLTEVVLKKLVGYTLIPKQQTVADSRFSEFSSPRLPSLVPVESSPSACPSRERTDDERTLESTSFCPRVICGFMGSDGAGITLRIADVFPRIRVFVKHVNEVEIAAMAREHRLSCVEFTSKMASCIMSSRSVLELHPTNESFVRMIGFFPPPEENMKLFEIDHFEEIGDSQVLNEFFNLLQHAVRVGAGGLAQFDDSLRYTRKDVSNDNDDHELESPKASGAVEDRYRETLTSEVIGILRKYFDQIGANESGVVDLSFVEQLITLVSRDNVGHSYFNLLRRKSSVFRALHDPHDFKCSRSDGDVMDGHRTDEEKSRTSGSSRSRVRLRFVEDYVLNDLFDIGKQSPDVAQPINQTHLEKSMSDPGTLPYLSQRLCSGSEFASDKPEDAERIWKSFSDLLSLNFDPFDFERNFEHPLYCISIALLQATNCLDILQHGAGLEKFHRYIIEIENFYQRGNLSYHSTAHAIDVVQTFVALLRHSGYMQKFTPLQIFSGVVAAVVHDVDHPGFSNRFLIKTSNALALRFSDQSPVEMHHLEIAFSTLHRPECNFTAEWSRERYEEFRDIVIQLVLATDVSKHLEILGHFHNRMANEGVFDLSDRKEVILLMQVLLKAADVSNPAKSDDMYKQWTDRIMEEFYMQGDEELKIGMPVSRYCDRYHPSIPECQAGFIDFVVRPLFEEIGNLSPDFNAYSDQISRHLQEWMDCIQAESSAGSTKSSSTEIHLSPKNEEEDD